MFQRIPKVIIVVLVVLITLLILVFGSIVLLRVNNKLNYKLSNIPFAGNILQNQQNSSGKIELVSEYPNYYLSRGHGFDNLVKLIENRGIFDKGLYVNKDSKYHSVGKMRIVLSPTELSKLAIKDRDSSGKLTTISAVDFGLTDNGVLNLEVYFIKNDEGLGDLANRDKIFNKELIRLIFLATAPSSFSDSKMRVFNAEEADEIFDQNYSNNLPIKIELK